MSDPSLTGGMPASNVARYYFKRAYQACINCRRRKVKCIMECNSQGLLQASCTRCRRELRHCTFSAERNSQTNPQDARDMQRTVNVIEGIAAQLPIRGNVFHLCFGIDLQQLCPPIRLRRQGKDQGIHLDIS